MDVLVRVASECNFSCCFILVHSHLTFLVMSSINIFMYASSDDRSCLFYLAAVNVSFSRGIPFTCHERCTFQSLQRTKYPIVCSVAIENAVCFHLPSPIFIQRTRSRSLGRGRHEERECENQKNFVERSDEKNTKFWWPKITKNGRNFQLFLFISALFIPLCICTFFWLEALGEFFLYSFCSPGIFCRQLYRTFGDMSLCVCVCVFGHKQNELQLCDFFSFLLFSIPNAKVMLRQTAWRMRTNERTYCARRSFVSHFQYQQTIATHRLDVCC